MNPKKRKLKNRDDLDCRKKKRRKLEKELSSLQNVDPTKESDVKNYFKKAKEHAQIKVDEIKEGIRVLKILKLSKDNKQIGESFKEFIKEINNDNSIDTTDKKEMQMFDSPEIPLLKEITDYQIQVYRFNKNVRKFNELKRIVGL